MNFYPENSSVPFVFAYLDDAGQEFVPAEVTIRLEDENGVLLETLVSGVPAPGSTRAEGSVAASFNKADGDEFGVRVLRAVLTRPDGVILERTITYAVKPSQSLRVPGNSFQSLARAQVMAAQGVNLTFFAEEPSGERQKAALMEAYLRIINRDFAYTILVNGRERTHYLTAESWEEMSEDTFDTQLPSAFKRALRQAQLVEADELLQGSNTEYARMHAAGIQSETIGESSITLRAGVIPGGGGALSMSTVAILAPFLDTSIRIGRA